jgi:L-lysine 2,3-aminomutase
MELLNMENIEYRKTATGRPTVVGTRRCQDPKCDIAGGRHEFHTKKYEKSGDEKDLNQRYSLCKNVCVYCYNQKRTKSAGTSLTEEQLRAKLAYYQDLLAKVTETPE